MHAQTVAPTQCSFSHPLLGYGGRSLHLSLQTTWLSAPQTGSWGALRGCWGVPQLCYRLNTGELKLLWGGAGAGGAAAAILGACVVGP